MALRVHDQLLQRRGWLATAALSVFALLLQPLIAVNLPAVFAATANITQLQILEADQTPAPNERILLKVRTLNDQGAPETNTTSQIKVSLASSSPTGEFAECNLNSSASSWKPITELTLRNNNTDTEFCYRDSNPGSHTLTISVAEPYTWSPATAAVTVSGDTAVDPDPVDPIDPTDPTDSNQLTLTGVVFHNRDGDRDRDSGEELLRGWEIRAYDSSWREVGRTETRETDGKYDIRINEAGVYHVCLVKQSGWTQTGNTSGSSVYVLDAENGSEATDEFSRCSTVTYPDTKNLSKATYFGVHDVTGPELEVLDADGKKLVRNGDVITIQAIDPNGIREIHANIRMLDDGGRVINEVVGGLKFDHDRNNVQNSVSHAVPVIGKNGEKLADGQYELRFTAQDTLRNGTKAHYHYFTVDNTKPGVSVELYDARFGLQSKAPEVTVTATDNLSGVVATEYKVMQNGSNVRGYGWTEVENGDRTPAPQLRNLPDGDYKLVARAFDRAGNKRSGIETSFTVDSTAPVAANERVYRLPANGGAPVLVSDKLLSGKIRVVLDITDDTAVASSGNQVRFLVGYDQDGNRVDSKAYTLSPTESPNEYSVDINTNDFVGEGVVASKMRLYVRTIDALGNKDGVYLGSYDYVVDNDRPDLQVGSPAAEGSVTTNQSIIVSGKVEDTTGVDRVVMYVNGHQLTTRQVQNSFTEDGVYSFAIPANILPAGNHRLIVNAYDRAGNSTTERVNFTVIDPPVIPVPEPAPESTPDPAPDPTPPAAPPSDSTQMQTPGTANVLDAQTFSGSTFSPLANPSGPLLALAPSAGNSADEEEEEEEVAVLGDEDSSANFAQIGDADAATDQDDEGCASFLGVCWYWWVAIVAALVVAGVLVRRAVSSNESSDPARRL